MTEVLDILGKVIAFLLAHPDLVALVLVILGAARVEGGKLLKAAKAKQWDALDDILVEFMTQAADSIMEKPERRAWVLAQTMQVARRMKLDKYLRIGAPEDLGRRMELLWTTVVQPRLNLPQTQAIVDAWMPKSADAPTESDPKEGSDPAVKVEVKEGKATLEADLGPVSVKLPLQLPW